MRRDRTTVEVNVYFVPLPNRWRAQVKPAGRGAGSSNLDIPAKIDVSENSAREILTTRCVGSLPVSLPACLAVSTTASCRSMHRRGRSKSSAQASRSSRSQGQGDHHTDSHMAAAAMCTLCTPSPQTVQPCLLDTDDALREFHHPCGSRPHWPRGALEDLVAYAVLLPLHSVHSAAKRRATCSYSRNNKSLRDAQGRHQMVYAWRRCAPALVRNLVRRAIHHHRYTIWISNQKTPRNKRCSIDAFYFVPSRTCRPKIS